MRRGALGILSAVQHAGSHGAHRHGPEFRINLWNIKYFLFFKKGLFFCWPEKLRSEYYPHQQFSRYDCVGTARAATDLLLIRWLPSTGKLKAKAGYSL